MRIEWNRTPRGRWVWWTIVHVGGGWTLHGRVRSLSHLCVGASYYADAVVQDVSLHLLLVSLAVHRRRAMVHGERQLSW